MPRDFTDSDIAENIQIAQEWCRSVKSMAVCTTCHDASKRRLEFHHRNPEEKEYDVGFMVREGFPLNAIFAEAAKCDLTCSDCHEEIHRNWRESGYWPKKPQAVHLQVLEVRNERRSISFRQMLEQLQMNGSA